MKLIIDIPEKLKDYADKSINNEVDYNMVVESINGSLALAAIAKGTPLPKVHGRLIDADKFSDWLVNASKFFRGDTADIFDTRFADGIKEADIKLVDAPTIIEADKAESEE